MFCGSQGVRQQIYHGVEEVAIRRIVCCNPQCKLKMGKFCLELNEEMRSRAKINEQGRRLVQGKEVCCIKLECVGGGDGRSGSGVPRLCLLPKHRAED